MTLSRHDHELGTACQSTLMFGASASLIFVSNCGMWWSTWAPSVVSARLTIRHHSHLQVRYRRASISQSLPAVNRCVTPLGYGSHWEQASKFARGLIQDSCGEREE